MRVLSRWQVFLLAAVALLLPAMQAQADTFLSVYDQARGQTFVHTEQNSDFSVRGNNRSISFYTTPRSDVPPPRLPRYDDFTVQIVAPPGQVLAPGLYSDVDCPNSVTGRAAGLQAYENNPPCAAEKDIYGWLVIRQIAFDSTGALTKLEAVFSQRVGSPTAPVRNGLLRYNAHPRSLSLRSMPRSMLGPINETYFGDSSLFSLTHSGADKLLYTASIFRSLLDVTIDTRGRPLQVGRYATHSDAGAAPVTMNLVEREDVNNAVVCRGPGMLDVRNVVRDGRGKIVGIHAEFEQYCGSDPVNPGSLRSGSVRGEIQFHR